jgi:type IV secretion system protein VirB5
MNRWHSRLLLLAPLFAMFSAPAAHAQWAVIDVASINQLVQEVVTLKQSLTTAQQELAQSQNAYAAITGNRGMSQLLSGIDRNYLPTDWKELQGVLTGASGSYGALAASVKGLVTANAVLTPAEIASLSVNEQAQLTADRNSAALLQAMTREALSTTSARFASLQELINEIPKATDEKGSLDLEARIGAEEAMLQNDQEKLGALFELARSQREAGQEQAQEQAIADIGSFSNLAPLKF